MNNHFIGTQIVESATPHSTTPFDHGFHVPHPYTGALNWVPKSHFERHYRPLNAMTFGQAMEAVRLGHTVRRKAWSDTTQVFQEIYESGPIPSQIMQRLRWEPKVMIYMYQPNQLDMAAQDWMTVTPESEGMVLQGSSLKPAN